MEYKSNKILLLAPPFQRASFNLNPLSLVLSAGAGIVGTHCHTLHPRLSKVPADLCTQSCLKNKNHNIYICGKNILRQLFGNRNTTREHRRGTQITLQLYNTQSLKQTQPPVAITATPSKNTRENRSVGKLKYAQDQNPGPYPHTSNPRTALGFFIMHTSTVYSDRPNTTVAHHLSLFML